MNTISKLIAAACVLPLAATAQNQNLLAVPQLYTESNINTGIPATNFTNTAASPTFNSNEYSISYSESLVYRRQLKYDHNNSVGDSKSFEIRIGDGGQMYYMRGEFGNCAPNQYRGWDYSPWNDEVWQGVAILEGFTGPGQGHIHQAGPYLRGDSTDRQPSPPAPLSPWFSHVVAEYSNPTTKAYSVVNWASRAHLYSTITPFASKILTWNTYTMLGDGILQLDTMIYNYGDIDCNQTAIYGGIRDSVLPYMRIANSNPEAQTLDSSIFPTIKYVKDTGGWVVFTKALGMTGTGGALGIAVHHKPGSDTEMENSRFFYGRLYNRNTDVFDTNRDQRIFTINRAVHSSASLSSGKLSKHETFFSRIFFVFRNTANEVERTIIDSDLTSAALNSKWQPSYSSVAKREYLFWNDSGSKITVNESTSTEAYELALKPFGNQSHPLFYIKRKNGNEFITNDPNKYTWTPSDGTFSEVKLLGFTKNPMTIDVLDTKFVTAGTTTTWSDGTNTPVVNSRVVKMFTVSANRIRYECVMPR